MKKAHIISLACICFALSIGVLIFLLSPQEEKPSQQNLAETQQVISIEKGVDSEKKEFITPEKQKQLDQITQIYSEQELAHHDSLVNILRKYNSNFSKNDQEILLNLVQESKSIEDFSSGAKEKLGINFLGSDIRKMMVFQETLTQEKQLELDRLELFMEKNAIDLNTNIKTLIELSIKETLKQNSALSSKDIVEISASVSKTIFTDNIILKQNTFQEQETLITNTLSSLLKTRQSLSDNEEIILINKVIKNISDLEILINPNDTIPDRNISFIPFFTAFDTFQKLIFHNTYAEESLSIAERDILILKTQIFIEKVLQESIAAEIQYNTGIINQGEYEDIVQENLIELEELVILTESLENDTEAISLSDIQRLNLGSYIDDSSEIQDLPVLAYIQSKSGHIAISNLNGSTLLGEENMSLYSGYSIETLDDSQATIIFSDESILRLEPLSKVTISAPSDSNINVNVETGSIWSRVLKPLLSGDVFTIESDGISLGVRGTSLSLEKSASETNINIVDSYTSDGSPSVIITETSGASTPIDAGSEININNAGIIDINVSSKEDILAGNSKISNFLKQDLSYMSLLIDDRTRGFYNTPIAIKNDSDNFLQKIKGELEVSLPQGSEKPYIIQNSELTGESVSTGSIYHLIQKDAIITTIKNSSSINKNLKIEAVKNLDMQSLEESLGNKRELENRINYNITQDIISQNTTSPDQLKDLFLDFPIETIESNLELLFKTKQDLTINSGSSIVTGNIFLPNNKSGIAITWESTDNNIISKTGKSALQNIDTSVILTATLSIGNLSTTKDFALTVVPRKPTELEELQTAAKLLGEYINFVSLFSDTITVPDFSSQGSITPLLTWSGAYVNSDGTTNRPAFSSSPDKYKSTAILVTLSHPTNPSITIDDGYDVSIQRKDITPEETEGIKSSQAESDLLAAKEILETYFSTRKDIKNNVDTIPLPLGIPTGVIISWNNVSPYLSTTGEIIERPNYNIGDQDKSFGATLSHNDTQQTQTLSNLKIKIFKDSCSGKIIDNDCYELVANAEYNNDYKLGNLSPIDESNLPALVTQDGQKGVKPLTSEGHHLSYDISSLQLGDDWAIEMSVRGEDLKRNDGESYYLLSSNTLSILTYNEKIYFSYGPGEGSPGKSILVNNGYNAVTFTSDKKLYLNGNYIATADNSISNNIKIGSSPVEEFQWNGIINFTKIYK